MEPIWFAPFKLALLLALCTAMAQMTAVGMRPGGAKPERHLTRIYWRKAGGH